MPRRSHMSSVADPAGAPAASVRWRDWRRNSPACIPPLAAMKKAMHEAHESRPASTSALLLAEPPPEALGRRPSAIVPLPPPNASPAIRRPSAVVPVNPAQMVANQQRFMLELMQERCSALRASLSGLSGLSGRPRNGGGGGEGKDSEPRRASKKFSQRIGEDALTAILSALYAKILVVLGFAFPVTEVLSKEVPDGFYQGFYLFLYVGSIAFMCFMYASLLKDRAVNSIIRMHSAFPSGSTEKDFEAQPTLRRPSMTPVVRYGSFYLRLGAIAFGIGSMVYSGLEFGEYFEFKHNTACHNPLQALNPATRIVLTLLQMQFIFLNSKDMKMWRHKVVARFGLMHTIACNLCEWLYVLVAETRHEIRHLKSHAAHGADHSAEFGADLNETLLQHAVERERRDLPMEDCRRSNIIGLLVQDASPFLFPCTVEYSLICAVVLYEMWKNVNKPPPKTRCHSEGDDTAASTPAPSAPATRPSSSTGDEDMENDSNEAHNTETSICPIEPHQQQLNALYHQHHNYSPPVHSHYHFSVDCAGAHKGLFLGIVVMVLTIISLILFFVLNKDPRHHKTAVLEVNIIELVLYVLCTVAVLLCMLRMRALKYRRKASHGHSGGGLSLDNSLLLIAQTGVYIYCMFSIIGCYFSDESDLGLVAELFSLVQTTAQTLFVLDAWSRRCRSVSQARRKPGRQIVTFLLVANMSMWSINTLEKGHASFRPSHLVFFGEWAWTIITRVSMPLAIFYRFHSTICLFEIWKNAYKFKPQFSL